MCKEIQRLSNRNLSRLFEIIGNHPPSDIPIKFPISLMWNVWERGILFLTDFRCPSLSYNLSQLKLYLLFILIISIKLFWTTLLLFWPVSQTCMQPNVNALPVKAQNGDVFEMNGITAVKLTDYTLKSPAQLWSLRILADYKLARNKCESS